MIFSVPARSAEAIDIFNVSLTPGMSAFYLSTYNSVRRMRTKLESFEVSAEDEYVTRLQLNFFENIVSDDASFETHSRHLSLRVFGASADRVWPISLVNSLWRGKYPSCVGVSDDGIVYLLFLTESSLELMTFSAMSDVQLEALLTCCNRPMPYRIFIQEDAMFQALAGDEGMNYLRANVFVEFDTGIRTRVSPVEQIHA